MIRPLTLPPGHFAPESPEAVVVAAVVAPDWAIHRSIIWDRWEQRFVRDWTWTATRISSAQRLPGRFRTPKGAKAAALAFNAAFPDFRARPDKPRAMSAAQKWWTAHLDELDLEAS